MKLGFIGFGEAAYALSSGLNEEGIESIFAYDPLIRNPDFSALIKSRAQESGVHLELSAEDVVRKVSVIIVAVPANMSLEVSDGLKKNLKAGDLYIDVSASSPEVKKQISRNVESKDALFVDAAMMGPLLVNKHQVPMLVSGSGADSFIKQMDSFGMNINKVGDIPGEATAIKLIRSIFMKGYAVLCYEMLEAAYKFDVQDTVIEGLGATLDGKSFESSMNRMVTGTSIHAERRSIELEGSIELLKKSNLNYTMARAVQEKLQLISSYDLKSKFEGSIPEYWIDVVSAIEEINK